MQASLAMHQRAALAATRVAAPSARPSTLRGGVRAPVRAATIVRAMAAKDEKKTLVKVCGVTTPEDATQAAVAGADFIGMILWPKSKRSIPLDVAKEVADAAKAAGATPIGVFVDESAEEIVAACEAVGIDHAQLHGDNARAALTDLPMKIKAVYVVSAAKDGAIVTPMPGDEEKLCEDRRTKLSGAGGWKAAIDWVNGPRRTIDWLLVDGGVAGSGETYDWTNLRVPRGCSRKGWILAGGLDPENVTDAIGACKPTAVDVASGVADEGGVKKDPVKVDAFIANAKSASMEMA